MEYVKRQTKILVKDDNGRIVQVIPETDAAAVSYKGDPLVDVVEALQNGKAPTVHMHVINDVSLLQDELDGKNPLIDEVSNEEILDLVTNY